MAAVYGSSTVANATSKGNTKAVQDMIAPNRVSTVTNPAMQNVHIGARQEQVVGALRAPQIAADGTPALKSDGTGLLWQESTGTWVAG